MKIIDNIKYHFRGFKKTGYVMLIICALPFLYSHVFEFFAPTSYFYEYKKGNEVEIVSGNAVGENLILHSNAEFHHAIEMKWWDTLNCDGIKIDTQLWNDFMTPSVTPEMETWKFRLYKFTDQDKDCMVCGSMYGLTSKGYEKEFEYCTKPFHIGKQ